MTVSGLAGRPSLWIELGIQSPLRSWAERWRESRSSEGEYLLTKGLVTAFMVRFLRRDEAVDRQSCEPACCAFDASAGTVSALGTIRSRPRRGRRGGSWPLSGTAPLSHEI